MAAAVALPRDRTTTTITRSLSPPAPPAPQITIQLFSDFQCPFCSRVRPTLAQVEQAYGSRVRIVWRDYPLPFHQNAHIAAEAAREVFAQGGDAAFWQYHDLLFDHQRELSEVKLIELAGQVQGVNAAGVQTALRGGTHRAAVDADIEAVRAAGARIGTPSFFINGRLVQGAVPFATLRTTIDRELAR